MTINTQSADWIAVRKYLETRIQALRDELEDMAADERKTVLARGGITELRNLIAHAESKSRQPPA